MPDLDEDIRDMLREYLEREARDPTYKALRTLTDAFNEHTRAEAVRSERIDAEFRYLRAKLEDHDRRLLDLEQDEERDTEQRIAALEARKTDLEEQLQTERTRRDSYRAKATETAISDTRKTIGAAARVGIGAVGALIMLLLGVIGWLIKRAVGGP